jgi:small subunit ribosomal protein S6
MRRYETFVIIDPDLSQEQREPLIGRVEELITQIDGFLVKTDDWGERKLAYDIKKKGRGYYVRFDYCGLAPLVNEIERFFRIDDRALKYMTILLNGDVDLEKVKEEKAAREAAAAETAAAKTATAETATAETATAETATAETATAETAAAETAAAETAAVEKPSDPDNAPEEDQTKELAPAEEKAKNDEGVPPSETEDSAAEKTPSSTKEEA